MARYCPYKNGPALYPECKECDNRLCDAQPFYCMVAGSRGYADYSEFCSVMDTVLSKQDDKSTVIVSGHCPSGADAFAERYAAEHGMALQTFPADWTRYGKRAGYIRNREMHQHLSKQADIHHRGVVLFWDGKSKGTAQSIDLAKEFRNPCRIWSYTQKGWLKPDKA